MTDEAVKPLIVWLRNPWSRLDGVERGPIPEWQAALMFEAANQLERLASETAQARADAAAAQAAQVGRGGIYVASKAKYGPEWVALRDAGLPIISTWIDQSGAGETSDWPALWTACIAEASSAAALVLICREGDVLKGAWSEVGAALACGVPVFATGIAEYSIRHHPGVYWCQTEAKAFDLALIAAAQEGRE